MHGLKVAMLIAFLSGSAVAFAAETTIRQKARLFSPNERTTLPLSGEEPGSKPGQP